MARPHNARFDRLYGRILLMFLVVLLPAVLLGAYFYLHTEKTLLTAAEATVSHALSAAVTDIDQQLEDITVTGELLNSADLSALDLSGANESSNIQRMQNFNALMNKLAVLNESLIHIALYTDGGRVISSLGIYPFDSFFSTYSPYEGYTLDTWRALLRKRVSMRYLPTARMTLKGVARDSEYVTLPVVTTVNTTSGRGILLFSIHLDALVCTLQEYSPYPEARFSIADQTGAALAGGAPDNAKDCVVITGVSSKNGWLYTAYVPRGVISESAWQSLVPVIGFVLGALLLGLALVVITSGRVYKPLVGLKNRLEAKHPDVDVSGLESLEQQVDRLLRSSDSDRQYLLTMAQSYAEALFLSQAMTEKRAKVLSDLMARMGFQCGAYQCAAIAFRSADESAQEEACAIWCRHFPLCRLRYDERVLLLIFETNALSARSAIEGAASALFTAVPALVRGIAVAEEICDVRQMHQGVNDSLTILRNIDEDAHNALLFAEDFDIVSQYDYTYRDEWSLVEAVQRGDEESLLRQLDAVLLKNYEKCVSHIQMMRLFDELRATCQRYAAQEHIALPPYTSSPLSLNEQRGQLHEMYLSLIRGSEEKGSPAHIQLTRDANQYIMDHYSEDIYVEAIASALGVSAKHLSKIYKQQSGLNISDQITMVRIGHARHLLSGSDLPVNAVIEQTGFSNRATFLRAFRKYAGLSPSAFRQLHRGESGAPLSPEDAEDE